MKYDRVIPAVFLDRPNRFIAHVRIGTENVPVHVKNTGRCRELLVSGCRVWLSVPSNPKRKTKYDLICVEKQRTGNSPLLINMDSSAPNDAAEEWLCSGALFPKDSEIRREVQYGNSRFDFQIRQKDRISYLEVKGVTLEDNGIVRFPDAPTERGVKHLKELTECAQNGLDAWILFVIQMTEVREFQPNDSTHAAFGDALRKAAAGGVHILAMECSVMPDMMMISKRVPVRLSVEKQWQAI